MISVTQSGDFKKTFYFLNKVSNNRYVKIILDKYGRQGVEALRSATPRDSGKTAESWGYETNVTDTGLEIIWKNSNVNDGVPIAIILQYGHGTGTGGYVKGRDYINPAIRPVFDKISQDLWREVTR